MDTWVRATEYLAAVVGDAADRKEERKKTPEMIKDMKAGVKQILPVEGTTRRVRTRSRLDIDRNRKYCLVQGSRFQ